MKRPRVRLQGFITTTRPAHPAPGFGEMFRNQVLNLSEGRISVVQAVFERP